MVLSHRRATRLTLGGALLLVVALLAAGCGGSGNDEEVASLRAQLSKVEQDATYWQQLTSLLQPVELTSMTDHRAYMLPNGHLIALHFDNLDLDKAKNLNWVALGIPGRFCRDDQQRVEREYGSGFTHFHDLTNDTHGGKPGAEGVWFVHVAVRDLQAPWGEVSQGTDANFMPSDPPACA